MAAKPFVKWAGGKGQLLVELENRLPAYILQGKTIPRYVEPFVGGGAMFFNLQNRYKIGESFLSDCNEDLILTYEVIKGDAKELIMELSEIEVFTSKNQRMKGKRIITV